MWLDPVKIKKLCKSNKLSLKELLQKAGVSKTAYYSLVRNSNLLPDSIYEISDALGVNARDLISDGPTEVAKVRRRESKLRKILNRYPNVSRDNIWHSLILLEKDPIERLRGALRRAG